MMSADEEFAWLRSLVGPNVTTITLLGGDLADDGSDVTVILTGATTEQVERVRTAIVLRFPLARCRVRS